MVKMVKMSLIAETIYPMKPSKSVCVCFQIGKAPNRLQYVIDYTFIVLALQPA